MAPFPENDLSDNVCESSHMYESTIVQVRVCFKYLHMCLCLISLSLLFRVQETDIAKISEKWKQPAALYRMSGISSN